MNTFHICLNIKGTLRKRNSQLEGLLTADGREMSGAEVRQYLRDQQAKGREYYSGCSNMGEDGRCKGHPVKEDAE